MIGTSIWPIAAAFAFAVAQDVVPPPPVLLTTTKSGVLPIIPTETPFTGLETNEGAIISPGPPRPGFVGPGGTATVESNLPIATYRADLPPTMFDPLVGTVISGSVVGVGTTSGVEFTVNLTGLPDASYGPFGYHVHNLPVPASGNCTDTMGHLDPYNRGELYMCDKATLQTCQTGDLSGKHGTITGETFTTFYSDSFLSTNPTSKSYFGGLSLVIHTNNRTRLTCANFLQVGGNSTGGATPTGTAPPGSTPPGSTSTVEPFPGGAAKATWSWAILGLVGSLFFIV